MKEDMLEAVKVETDQMLEKANEEKAFIIQEAYDQSEKIKTEAYQTSYDEGYREGIANGYGEANGYIEEALGLKSQYYQKFEEIKATSENDITGVIISTIEKILNKHIQDDYDLIRGLVEKALEKCAFTTNLSLRVAPEDYDSAVSMKKYILSLTENVEDIEIKRWVLKF